METKKQFSTIDEYVDSCPADVQSILEKIREIVKGKFPGTKETISYQIPTFSLNGKSRVYVGAWKDHIAIYPVPHGPESLQKELSPYVSGRGTVRFSLNKPIPYDLIEKIVNAQMKQKAEI